MHTDPIATPAPRRRAVGRAAVLVAGAVTLAACGAAATPVGGPVRQQSLGNGASHVVLASAPAPDTPSAADTALVAQEEQEFSLALTRALFAAHGQQENVLTSPFSADAALSMLAPGARGATAAAIARALQASGASTATTDRGWDGLLAASTSDLGPVELRIADSVWMQHGVDFERPYLEALARDFGDQSYQADFAGNMPGAVQAINAWVSAATDGSIRQVLQPSSLAPSTILVLANALHFKAAWASGVGFSTGGDEAFRTGSGADVQVPVVSATTDLRVASATAYQAVAVPYAGGRFEALLVQPAGSMTSFLAGLTTARLADIVGSLRPEMTALVMPTLSLSNDFSMVPALTALGMGTAFSPAADLSGISPQAYDVSSVEQANRLVVNAWGTDLASATIVGVVGSAEPVASVHVTIDRPYLYLLRDTSTGAIVASAVVEDPAASA